MCIDGLFLIANILMSDSKFANTHKPYHIHRTILVAHPNRDTAASFFFLRHSHTLVPVHYHAKLIALNGAVVQFAQGTIKSSAFHQNNRGWPFLWHLLWFVSHCPRFECTTHLLSMFVCCLVTCATIDSVVCSIQATINVWPEVHSPVETLHVFIMNY